MTSSDFAVRAEGLGKTYRIRHQTGMGYVALRDVLTDRARGVAGRVIRPFSGRSPQSDGRREDFWALRDVSFEIGHGERVGIIGRNGAGKSTLLKILSRITDPTEGRVRIRGRVSSLLEVGTGFHPELTGRENIYLNGAVLGMDRAEIRAKFDEIVAFAEVEKFLDTPVKRYSSGMYVRLAFAVAAHLEPEILIVDEVLAVGDASFQKKCLGKMESVGQEGRTVLFVSHTMAAITRLCERAILLDQGRVVADAPAHQTVAAYLRSGLGSTGIRVWNNPARAPGDGVVRLRSVRVVSEHQRATDVVDIRRPVGVEIEYDVLTPGRVLAPNVNVTNSEGIVVFAALDLDPNWRARPRPKARFTTTCWIPGNFLTEGDLTVGVAVCTLEPWIVHIQQPDVVAFHVRDSLDGDSARGGYAGHMPGVVRPMLEWSNRIHEDALDSEIDRKGTVA